MKICAVIPAAGSGSRLGMRVPKLLVPLSSTQTLWSFMRAKLVTLVDHINIIISPDAEHHFQSLLKDDINDGLVSLGFQSEPSGMGDAIFCGYSVWSQAKSIVVLWGDQVFVSQDTLTRCIASHAGKSRTIALPLTRVLTPYVEYIFNDESRLVHIKQTREGDVCSQAGLADVGTFVISVGDLLHEWNAYMKQAKRGQQTGEVNFLPFLPFLSSQGWYVRTTMVQDAVEARGINTPDDLVFFQNLFREKGIICS